ncbi:MAG TPA: hypothetical protein VIV60_20355, partial [Polyangiaceae bacterium]
MTILSWLSVGCGGAVDSPMRAAAGAGGLGGAGAESPIDCARRSLADGPFEKQAFDQNGPPPRVIYSWTTLEQVTELRSGGA